MHCFKNSKRKEIKYFQSIKRHSKKTVQEGQIESTKEMADLGPNVDLSAPTERQKSSD